MWKTLNSLKYKIEDILMMEVSSLDEEPPMRGDESRDDSGVWRDPILRFVKKHLGIKVAINLESYYWILIDFMPKVGEQLAKRFECPPYWDEEELREEINELLKTGFEE